MSYHTEPEGWGTKYPLLMKNLYFDKLSWEDVEEARKNLKEIQSILQKKKPEEIIWDIEDITKRLPWEGKALPPQVVDLVTYFAREDGKTFSDLLFKAFDFSETLKHEIVIRKSLTDTTF